MAPITATNILYLECNSINVPQIALNITGSTAIVNVNSYMFINTNTAVYSINISSGTNYLKCPLVGGTTNVNSNGLILTSGGSSEINFDYYSSFANLIYCSGATTVTTYNGTSVICTGRGAFGVAGGTLYMNVDNLTSTAGGGNGGGVFNANIKNYIVTYSTSSQGSFSQSSGTSFLNFQLLTNPRAPNSGYGLNISGGTCVANILTIGTPASNVFSNAVLTSGFSNLTLTAGNIYNDISNGSTGTVTINVQNIITSTNFDIGVTINNTSGTFILNAQTINTSGTSASGFSISPSSGTVKLNINNMNCTGNAFSLLATGSAQIIGFINNIFTAGTAFSITNTPSFPYNFSVNTITANTVVSIGSTAVFNLGYNQITSSTSLISATGGTTKMTGGLISFSGNTPIGLTGSANVIVNSTEFDSTGSVAGLATMDGTGGKLQINCGSFIASTNTVTMINIGSGVSATPTVILSGRYNTNGGTGILVNTGSTAVIVSQASTLITTSATSISGTGTTVVQLPSTLGVNVAPTGVVYVGSSANMLQTATFT